MKTQSSSASAIFASAIGLYAVFDTLILGLPILVLAVRYNSLVVFGIAVLSVFLLNVACCTWVDAHWSLFAAGPGGRVEARIQKLPRPQVAGEADRLDHERVGAELRAGGGGDQRDPRRGDGAGRDRFSRRSAADPHSVAHLRAVVLGGLLLLRICTGKGHRPALSGCATWLFHTVATLRTVLGKHAWHTVPRWRRTSVGVTATPAFTWPGRTASPSPRSRC